MALLARAAAEGQDRHLHERVVQRAARGARCAARSTTASSTRRWRRSGISSGCSPTRASSCSSSGSTCRRKRRRSGCGSSSATRARAGASRATTGTRRASTPIARPVGARAARDVDRRSAVVRRRGHRRALSEPDGRQDPAATPCSGSLAEKKRPGAATRAAPPAPSVIDNVKLIRDLDLTQKVSTKEIRTRARALPGQARDADAQQAVRRALAGPRLRRRRRRRQGRRHPAHHRGARRAPVRDRADRRADRRGARAALPVALLAAGAAAGRHRDLRSLLVRPRAGRAGRGLLRAPPTGCAPTTRSTSSRSSSSTPARSS